MHVETELTVTRPRTGWPLMKTSPVSELLTTRLNPSSFVPTYGMVAVAAAARANDSQIVDIVDSIT